jgi:hypothetical protein
MFQKLKQVSMVVEDPQAENNSEHSSSGISHDSDEGEGSDKERRMTASVNDSFHEQPEENPAAATFGPQDEEEGVDEECDEVFLNLQLKYQNKQPYASAIRKTREVMESLKAPMQKILELHEIKEAIYKDIHEFWLTVDVNA